MKRSIKTITAIAVTMAIVASSLLLPRKLMVSGDEKVNGVVSTADKIYYTGALDAYAGEDDLYTRLMLVTGKWESRQETLPSRTYDAIEQYQIRTEAEFQALLSKYLEFSGGSMQSLDYISRISLQYWSGDETYDWPLFMGMGNAVRTVCNLTAFDLMPRMLSLYYASWAFSGATVYRYTDTLFQKYISDSVLMKFKSSRWDAEASLLVDARTGDFIGLRVQYDYPQAEKWVSDFEKELAEGHVEEELAEMWAMIPPWRSLFLDGEMLILQDGTEIYLPLTENRAEKQEMNANVATFLERINFSYLEPVTNPEELVQIVPVPNISDEQTYDHDLGNEKAKREPFTYAYIVEENGSEKKFYFVISSNEGIFEAYFSPMTEKTAGNNLTKN